MTPRRVVSLSPDCTEIVCALGCQDRLVGRSHECDYPPEIRSLPVITAPKFAVGAESRQIDQAVKSAAQQQQSLYEINAELLKQLRPQLVLVQGQCDVCAVSLDDVKQAGVPEAAVLSLSASHLADLWKNIQTAADVLGVTEDGRELLSKLKNRVVDIIQKTCMLKKRPTVACLEWLDPLMAAGNWIPELVDFSGGTNLFGAAGKHSPWLEWNALVEANPDIIVLTPCGFDKDRTREESVHLTGRPEWKKLRAVKSRQVFITDGNQYFNRPGPRLVESLEILSEIAQPKMFSFGHARKGWEPL